MHKEASMQTFQGQYSNSMRRNKAGGKDQIDDAKFKDQNKMLCCHSGVILELIATLKSHHRQVDMQPNCRTQYEQREFKVHVIT